MPGAQRENESGNYVEVKDAKGHTVYDKYPIQIRDGNCMAIFLHIHKIKNLENPKKCWMHDLIMFFVDEPHLKRCLHHDGKNETFESLFYGKLQNIKLNIYYKNMLTLARYLTRDGHKVTCYYEEPKNE